MIIMFIKNIFFIILNVKMLIIKLNNSNKLPYYLPLFFMAIFMQRIFSNLYKKIKKTNNKQIIFNFFQI